MAKIAGYETHPVADIFPLLAGKELDDLADDVKVNGLLQPIMLHEGKILDGRNRALACERAGVRICTEVWTGTGSPAAWVVSQNLHRRHLTASQRAMVGAALVPMFEKEARVRQAHGATAPGKTLRANLPEALEAGRAREKAAEAVNVSPRSLADAVKVTREAAPEVVEAVKQGEVAVSAAARATRPPRDLPKSKRSRGPKASPRYTVLLVMPTNRAAETIKALRAMGFYSTKSHGPHDAEMQISTAHRRTA